jgi:flavin reductase (DIM6/NTAB) family NADH-FMN oxidoreductase RutF
VTAVAALVDGVPTGITANSFTSVSPDPPIVSVHGSRYRRLSA